MHADIDAVLGDRIPTYEDVEKLVYTRVIFDEALRLYPPVPFLTREALKDNVIMGRPIAKGTILMVIPWLLHRHKEYWDEPEKFRPEHFINPVRSHKNIYIPFSAGPRYCPRATFGITESVLCLAMIGRHHRLQLKPGTTVEPQCRLTLSNAYMSLAEFASQPVHDGDTLIVGSDLIEGTLFVSVAGHSSGPSAYSVLRGTRLTEVLDVAAVDPMVADLDAIYLQRIDVAESQKAALQRALDELQRTVLTATSSSPSEAQIRVAEAQLIQQFIDRARLAEPEGRVYLGGDPADTNLLLEDGDTIVIPQQSDLVMISGEVRLPQTTVFNENFDVADYVDQSGGHSDRADSSGVLVLRLGGEVLHEANPEIRPGDHILVLPSAGDKSLALIKDLVEIVFRVALSTGIVIFDD